MASYPCTHCHQGTVIYKNDFIVECQSCFMTTIAPQQTPTFTQQTFTPPATPTFTTQQTPTFKTNSIEAQPLLSAAGVKAPTGPIPLIGESYNGALPTSGGACPHCGTFYAWQRGTDVVCPHCSAKSRTGLANRRHVYIFMAACPLFLIVGIVLAVLPNFRPVGFAFMAGSAFYLVLAIVFWKRANNHDNIPLIDCHPLAPDETARLAYNWPL